MSNIITKADPYIAQYVYEKESDPNAQIVLRAYQKRIVDMVDHIVELAHGQRDFVTSDTDWKVVEEIIRFFSLQWPNEFNEFRSVVSDIRATRGDGGYSESREIKYTGSIPPRLMRMIKAIFPAQQWDKKFTNKFVNRFKLFKVGV